MAKVIALIISVFALAFILRLVFKLRGVGEAVEIELRDIEGWKSEKTPAAAKSTDTTEAIRD